MTGHLLWTVFVDYPDEKRWRETLGQSNIDAWCAAHGWDSKDIISGSVAVYGYGDGDAEVVAYRQVRDETGRAVWAGREPAQITVTSLLRQSLPENIGTVIR